MKLIDLDFDCLENILEYLELIDLLNVADSTKQLNKAAKFVFNRKYYTANFKNIIISPRRLFQIESKYITVNDLKTSLQLIRCVGQAIARIIFNTNDEIVENAENQFQIDSKVIVYIKKYCAECLKEFTMLHGYNINLPDCRRDLLKYFDKPFTNLVEFSTLDQKFSEKTCLKNLFPKLQRIRIGHYKNTSFYSTNVKYFPYLEELWIDESGIDDSAFFKNEMVLPFLQLNPQIKSLCLISENFGCSFLNINLIRDTLDSLKNIETLTLQIKPIKLFKSTDDLIHMSRVKSFEIHLEKIAELPICFIPFSFSKLEKFAIFYPKEEFRSSFNEEFYKFIEKHSKIKHLSIDIETPEIVDWPILIRSLPLLVEITLPKCWFSGYEAIKLMTKLQNVKKIHFRLSDDYDRFCKRLDKMWEKIYKTDKKSVELVRIF